MTERGVARLGWMIVLVGFGGFVAWSALAPLDSGVAVDGVVTVSGYRRVVQHPTGGVIEQIGVRDGDRVVAGQVLMQVESKVSSAEAASAHGHRMMAQAVQARLLAERDGLASVRYAPELLAQGDTDAEAAMALQSALFTSRRQALDAELAGLREALAGVQAQLQGLTASRLNYRDQREALSRRLESVRVLAEEDYVPRNRLLELQGTLAQLDGNMSTADADIVRAQRQLVELQARRTQRLQAYQQEVRAALADAQLDLGTQSRRAAAAQSELGHADIRAPVSGRVVGLKVFTAGGVIRPGEPLAEVVPDDEPLWVDARIPVEMIDHVREQLPVELLFTAFNRSTTPRVAGRVMQVSADRLVEPNAPPYYALRIEVAADDARRLRGMTIQPGMPVQAFVRTGERSLLNYLLKPLADRAHVALSGG